MSEDRLLTPEQTAKRLGLQVGTLATWRATRRGGPNYIRVGRSIKYAESAVREYLERRTIVITPVEARP